MSWDRKLTPERKALRRQRWDNPLGQPEVEDARRNVLWDISVRSVIPETTAKLMPEISRLAAELLVLSTCINDAPQSNDLSQWEVCARLLGVDIPADIDALAPRPSTSRSESWYEDTKKRRMRLKHFVDERALAQTQRIVGTPPGWIPDEHAFGGWMIFLDRLNSAVHELSHMKPQVSALLKSVKKRTKIEQLGAMGPDHRLPASSNGGRSQTVKRRYAYRLAAVLAYPDWQKPALDFEPWTEGELAVLFKKMGYPELNTAASVKELIRPFKRAIAHRKGSRFIPSPSNYYGPHIRRSAKQGAN